MRKHSSQRARATHAKALGWEGAWYAPETKGKPGLEHSEGSRSGHLWDHTHFLCVSVSISIPVHISPGLLEKAFIHSEGTLWVRRAFGVLLPPTPSLPNGPNRVSLLLPELWGHMPDPRLRTSVLRVLRVLVSQL